MPSCDVEIWAKLADKALSMLWEGNHVRIVIKPRGLTKEVVTPISAYLQSIGCRCVLDVAHKQQVHLGVK